MGDEACWDGCKKLLRNILPVGWQMSSLNGYDFFGDEQFDALVLGGGTLLSPHGNLGDAAIHEAKNRRVPYFIFGTGLESINWEGLPEYQQLRDFVDMVCEASLIGVRGPLSKDYLVALGVPADRVQIVGDLAVVLESYLQSDLNFQFGEGKWLGVNIGTSFGRVYGGNESHMAYELGRVLRELVSQRWKVCLFPVWPRDIKIQKTVTKQLADIPDVMSIEKVLTHRKIISLVGNFDAIIAMKLHAGIFAAIAGTPYLPWAYRPKIEDFATSIGLENFIVRSDSTAQKLLSAFKLLEQNNVMVKSRMDRGISRMRKELTRFAFQIVDKLKQYYP